ncbi:MAG: hypothetical protein IJL50_00980 [Bacteroidaceae bacterium]|nr:hypothetical protein [Bacteroidaceae bacterium]
MTKIDFAELEYQALKDALNNSTSNDATPDSTKNNSYSIDELRKLQKKQQEECLKPVVYVINSIFGHVC